MINETVLRDVLIALAKQQKSISELTSSLLDDVAYLRQSVEELGPTKNEIQSRRKSIGTNPIAADIAQSCNELIRRLTSGEVC
jgi:hypothetical protein